MSRLRTAYAVLRGRTVVYRATVEGGTLVLHESDGFVVNESTFSGISRGWIAGGTLIRLLLRLGLIRPRHRAAIEGNRSNGGRLTNSVLRGGLPK